MLFSPSVSLSKYVSLKAVSSYREGANNIINEQIMETPISDSTPGPASSSKLVLVVGGTGGVGKFPFILSHLFHMPFCIELLKVGNCVDVA